MCTLCTIHSHFDSFPDLPFFKKNKRLDLPYALPLFTPAPSVLHRIQVHFAAGKPAGRLRLAEPGSDLVVPPAECQRALGQRAVWTTPPGPLRAPV